MAEPEQVDATRRTRLAGERTYLAWWRTGLTALGVAVATGRLIPAVSGGKEWPYEVLGVLFALVGLAFIAYAYIRQRDVERALRRGEYAPFTDRPALVASLLGGLLGVGTILLVVAHPS